MDGTTRLACRTALTLVLALASCGKLRARCDSAALEQIATQLELDEPPPNTTEDAIMALAKACPTIHPVIPVGMSVDYAQGPADQQLQLMDEDFRALSRKLCAAPDAWLAVARELPAEARDAKRYELCQFGRFGVLDEGETYLGDDYFALHAHLWMLDHGVDAGLARRVTRGLMSATTSLPLLARRCEGSPEHQGCRRIYGLRGLQLPRSTSLAPSQAGIEVEVSTTQLRLGETFSLALDKGRLPEGASAHRVITDLWPAMRAAVDAAQAASDAGSLTGARGLRIAADRRVPFGTIAELMYTARRAGLERFELLSDRGGELGVVELVPPARWYRPVNAGPGRERLSFEADARGVHIVERGSEQTLAWDDSEAQSEFARSYTRGHPERREFELRIDDGVPIDAIIGLLDHLRGLECEPFTGREDDEDARAGCYLDLPILSLRPPIPGRAVDWDGLQLELEPGERKAAKTRGPVAKAKVRERIEAWLPELRTCLVESDAARAAAPEHLGLGFGETEEGGLALRLFSSPEFDEPCLFEVLGAQRTSDERFMATYYLDLSVKIDSPPLSGPGFDD